MKTSVLALAAIGAALIPMISRAQDPSGEIQGRIAVLHVVPDSGEEDEAYVRRVLRRAPEIAGVAHVFLRPGGDAKVWGESFAATKGLAYFASPEEFSAAKVDGAVPAVIVLGRGGIVATPAAGGGAQSYSDLPDWSAKLGTSLPDSDIGNANAAPGKPAVGGFDVTTYFEGKPSEGSASITARYRGVTYAFASEQNRLKFDLDPERFIPAYGGWCAWAMVDGEKVDVDPETYKIVDGRLLFFYNGFLGNTLKKWNKGNEVELKEKADGQWVRLGGRKAE